MYSLENYVQVIISMFGEAKDSKARDSILKSWFSLLEKHHRILEIKKIEKLIDKEVERRKEKALLFVSRENREEEKGWREYFTKKGITVEFKIDPGAIGGTKAIWKNLSIDNSIAGQLKKVRRRLA